jgi:hypothetical protein
MKGEEVDAEPGREIKTILELIEKLTNDSVQEIKSLEEMKAFKDKYGDSLLLAYNNKEADYYKCIKELANTKYRQFFYIAAIDELMYESSIKTPALIVNENYKIYLDGLNKRSCHEIERFLEANKLPVMKHLDSGYIKRLQKENKLAIIAALDLLKNDHRLWMSTIFTTTALKNRDYVFVYIDSNQDTNLFNYFKVGGELPQLIAFDFENRYHYIQHNNKVDELLTKLKTNNIQWSTGNWFEDILLTNFGFKLTQTFMMYFLGGSFVVLIVLLIGVIFCCGESNSEEDKANERELEETKKKKEQ